MNRHVNRIAETNSLKLAFDIFLSDVVVEETDVRLDLWGEAVVLGKYIFFEVHIK